jgi:hypothetical protein
VPGENDVALALVDAARRNCQGESVLLKPAALSGSRCGYRKRAPSTWPPITVPPLAAKTMSGSPGSALMVRT